MPPRPLGRSREVGRLLYRDKNRLIVSLLQLQYLIIYWFAWRPTIITEDAWSSDFFFTTN
jgi:hypothetical protein